MCVSTVTLSCQLSSPLHPLLSPPLLSPLFSLLSSPPPLFLLLLFSLISDRVCNSDVVHYCRTLHLFWSIQVFKCVVSRRLEIKALIGSKIRAQLLTICNIWYYSLVILFMMYL